MTLSDKVVGITGAGQGLGREYALAASRAGATLVLNDVDSRALDDVAERIWQLGGRASTVTGSVASWEGARAITDVAVRNYGRLDGFVANAGVFYESSPWEESEDALRRLVDVNILGVAFCGRHAMRAMVESGRGGSVVLIVSGAQFGLPRMSAYGASKGAVMSLTHNWAKEGKNFGVRVNAISPLAKTSMAALNSDPSLPPLPSPEIVAPVVTFLLSDYSREYTGKVFRFDGETLGSYALPELTTVASRTDWTPEVFESELKRFFSA